MMNIITINRIVKNDNNNNNHINNNNGTTSKPNNSLIEPQKQLLPKKRKAIEEIMEQQEAQKEKKNRRDNWICENVIVKVLSKEFADGKYYKQKGTIKKVFDDFVALLRMNESGDLIKIDQAELETVIPQPGGQVRIVNGAYRGQLGSLVSVNTEKYSANIKIESGAHLGTIIEIPYEDICKITNSN